MLLITFTLVQQIRLLLNFWRMHHRVVWVKAETPANFSEVEDPLLALLVRMNLMRPRNRAQGEYAPPENDPELEEPHRTEDALSKAFSCGTNLVPIGALVGRSSQWWQRRRMRRQQAYAAGYALERLPSWMDGASGTHLLGIGYFAVQFALQMLMAFSTGFLFVHPFGLTRLGNKVGLAILIMLNLAMAGSTGWGSANDIWGGLVTTMCYVLEALALCFVLASVLVMGSELPEDLEESERFERVSMALTLASYSASTLKYASYVPLAFTCYDTLVVPIVAKFRVPGSGCDLRTVLMTIITAPIVIGQGLLGINNAAFEQAAVMVDATSATLEGALEDLGGSEESKANSDEGADQEEGVQRWAFQDVSRPGTAQRFDGQMIGQPPQVEAIPDMADDGVVELLADDLQVEGELPARPLNQLLLEDHDAEVAAQGELTLDTANPSPEPTSRKVVPRGLDILAHQQTEGCGPPMPMPSISYPTRCAPQLAPQLRRAMRTNALKQRVTAVRTRIAPHHTQGMAQQEVAAPAVPPLAFKIPYRVSSLRPPSDI